MEYFQLEFNSNGFSLKHIISPYYIPNTYRHIGKGSKSSNSVKFSKSMYFPSTHSLFDIMIISIQPLLVSEHSTSIWT